MPPTSSPKPIRRAARPACPPRQTNGGRTDKIRRNRTTCDISQEANSIVDAARVWVRIAGASASKGAFMDRAVVAYVRQLMAENPGFSLPPGMSLDFIDGIKPNNPNGGNP